MFEQNADSGFYVISMSAIRPAALEEGDTGIHKMVLSPGHQVLQSGAQKATESSNHSGFRYGPSEVHSRRARPPDVFAGLSIQKHLFSEERTWRTVDVQNLLSGLACFPPNGARPVMFFLTAPLKYTNKVGKLLSG